MQKLKKYLCEEEGKKRIELISTVDDIQIKWSVLKVSNLKVFSSEYTNNVSGNLPMNPELQTGQQKSSDTRGISTLHWWQKYRPPPPESAILTLDITSLFKLLLIRNI